MWTRYELKSAAAGVLKNCYWKSLLVILIGSFIGSGIGQVSFNTDMLSDADQIDSVLGAIANNWQMVLGMLIWSFIISILVSVFLSAPLNVGVIRFFNESARGRVRIEDILFSVSHGLKTYFNIVKVLFMKSVFLVLWGLIGLIPLIAGAAVAASYTLTSTHEAIALILGIYAVCIIFFIPFIYKSYQYMMVDYILTDYPDMTWKQAIEASKQMTKGQVWRMIVLQLSFAGWIILGLMTFGIGVVFVTPYMNAVYTQLYFTLKQNVFPETAQSCTLTKAYDGFEQEKRDEEI